MAKSTWVIDAPHSSLDFSIRHLMVSNVKGAFHNFSAKVVADPEDLTTAEIEFVIDLESVDTRNKDRDEHLRNADFFDVEQYPQMLFRATSITRVKGNEYDVTGDVTLHGITRSETFSVTFEGMEKDPWGNVKSGFSGKGVLNRSDYGLTYNAILETGGIMVGDQVKIFIEIEAAQQA
ncbi:YceI family protein [Paenibacillus sepulcri]|uniref:YceI family protein n=1 Tax=Paenibacillus sepulcri TaxID=359917 RepID=A0ABS7C276_9BACL|nr:YceI family protein [Paenibacillus sepulcri]